MVSSATLSRPGNNDRGRCLAADEKMSLWHRVLLANMNQQILLLGGRTPRDQGIFSSHDDEGRIILPEMQRGNEESGK